MWFQWIVSFLDQRSKWINDPQFIGLDENGRYSGSVAENLDPGADVITVTATDRDEFPDFKKVFTRAANAVPLPSLPSSPLPSPAILHTDTHRHTDRCENITFLTEVIQ